MEQLYKKQNGQYIKVYPLNYIENILDSESGKTLASILSNFNNISLPYQDNAQDTRALVPQVLRRKGLWITYNNGEEYITEYYKGTAEDIQEYWSEDYNWEQVPNLEFVQNESSKIPDGIITPEKLSPALQELIKLNNSITNLPDDEDLEEVNSVIRFKDRKYNAGLASGKGYKILRKNWTRVGIKMVNVLTQNMINEPNTIYEIRYDFDLNEQEITIPEGCVLKFNGGSLNNGVIDGKIENKYIYPEWFGIKPNDTKKDIAWLILYCSSNNKNLILDKGVYYCSQICTKTTNKWSIKGQSTPYNKNTIIAPFEDNQRYIIKLGGESNFEKPTNIDNNYLTQYVTIEGVTFSTNYGHKLKEFITEYNGETYYTYGCLIVEWCSNLRLDIKFDAVSCPSIYIANSWEIYMDYLVIYGSWTDMNTPAIEFGIIYNDVINSNISALTINLLGGEIIRGPLIESHSLSVVDITINTINVERNTFNSLNGNKNSIIENDKVQKDVINNIRNSFIKLPLIKGTIGSMIINNLQLNNFSVSIYKDNNGTYIDELFNLTSASCIAINTINLSPFYLLYCEIGKNSSNIGSIKLNNIIGIAHFPNDKLKNTFRYIFTNYYNSQCTPIIINNYTAQINPDLIDYVSYKHIIGKEQNKYLSIKGRDHIVHPSNLYGNYIEDCIFIYPNLSENISIYKKMYFGNNCIVKVIIKDLIGYYTEGLKLKLHLYKNNELIKESTACALPNINVDNNKNGDSEFGFIIYNDESYDYGELIIPANTNYSYNIKGIIIEPIYRINLLYGGINYSKYGYEYETPKNIAVTINDTITFGQYSKIYAHNVINGDGTIVINNGLLYGNIGNYKCKIEGSPLYMENIKKEGNTNNRPTILTNGYLYYNAEINNLEVYYNGEWKTTDGYKSGNKHIGDSESRPTLNISTGFSYYDTTQNRQLWWNGSNWIDSNSNNADFLNSGIFSQKPSNPSIGFAYFCTDKQTTEGSTNGIMIYHKGDNVWVDALGRVIE